jgi:hypothetical protein
VSCRDTRRLAGASHEASPFLAHLPQGLRRHFHGLGIGIVKPFGIVDNALQPIERWSLPWCAPACQFLPANSPPPFIGSGPGAIWRDRTELMRLTRTELCALAGRMTTALSEFPEGSYEYATAYVNLRNIRAALAQRDFSP